MIGLNIQHGFINKKEKSNCRADLIRYIVSTVRNCLLKNNYFWYKRCLANEYSSKTTVPT
jgi:hypothetical protein